MSDLISRQAVLELLQMKYFGKDLYKAIYELPSAENKEEWIPISSIDEIPKNGAYWVTFKYKNGDRAISHIGWDTYHEHWDDEEGWALDDGDSIIAYMPYFEPEPYKEAYSYDLTHMFEGVTEMPKDAFKGWTTEELLGHKKDSHKEWWDSFYKREVNPNE